MSSKGKLSAEDIRIRGSLLAKNKELVNLHKELVFTGLLSEEEFWETRQGLLRAHEAFLKQKRGQSATLQQEETAKPVTGTTGTGDIKYVLTPAIIKTIFETHPILKKAFADLVKDGEKTGDTSTLTEKEFWVEYFKSKFFNERPVAGTASALLDPYFEEEMKQKKSSEEADDTLDKFSGLVDQMNDISRSLEDHVSSDYVQDIARNDASWKVLRQFNLHSLKVLQSSSSETKLARNADYIEISDLNLASEPALATLNVQESVFTLQSKNEMDIDVDFDGLKNNLLSSLKVEKKTETLLDCQSFKSEADVQLEANHLKAPLVKPLLPNESADKLNHLIKASLEVLNHFWRATAISNATERNAKQSKLISVVEQMETKVVEFIKTSANAQQACLNLLQVFAAAKLKYQESCK